MTTEANGPEIFYKIKRPDGLFSTGGHTPKFSKIGKVWRSLGALRNHLNQVTRGNGSYPHGSVIVGFEAVERSFSSVADELRACQERKERRRKAAEDSWKRAEREAEIRKLKELKDKYPNV